MSCSEVVQWDANYAPIAQRPAMHVWRLYRREPRYVYDTPADEIDIDFGLGPGKLAGFAEVWYCERCRLVEEAEIKLDGEESDGA